MPEGRGGRATSVALSVALLLVCSRRLSAQERDRPPETLPSAQVAGDASAGFSNPYEVRLQAARAALAQYGRSPQAIGPTLELLGLVDKVSDEALLPVLRPVAASVGERGAHDPLVGAWAAFHLARLHDDRAEAQAAAELRRSLGLIESFWVVGPFEAQSRAALSDPLPPEAGPLRPQAPQGSEGFEGKFQGVSWRPVEFASRSGIFLVDAALAPAEEAAALMLVYLHSDRAQPAALRLGSTGPVRAWLNGKPVLSHEVQRPARLDQDTAVLRLEKGENVLVIKSLNLQGAWRLIARVTDPQGRPLRGMKVSLQGKREVQLEPDPVAPARAQRLAVRPQAARQLGAELEAQWQRALDGQRTERAQALGLSLARLWAHASPFDQQEKPAERVLKATLALGPSLDLWRLLGEVAAEDNDRRSALESALALKPRAADRCLLLSGLGELAQAARRPVRAQDLRRQAEGLKRAGAGACWPAAVALAEEARVAGLPSMALVRLQALPEEVRQLPPVRKRLLRVLQSLGRVSEATAEAKRLAAMRATDADVVDMLLQQARVQGDAGALAEGLARLVEQRPDLSFWVQDWARALEGADQVAEAVTVLQAATQRTPGAAELHESLGRLLARQGQTEAAVAALEKALALRPQNPALRRYKEALARRAHPDGGEEAASDLARKYALDASETARAALTKETPEHPVDAAHVLLERRVVRVHDNGLSDVFAQRLVHVLTEQGARQNETFYIRYTPGSQEVELRQARVYRRNDKGQVEITAATGRDDRDLSEPWYALYYDNRAEVVTFEGLRPGDVIEIQYTVADVSARNELAGYFGDFQFVAETEPTDLWQYVLVAPKTKRFFFHAPAFEGFSQSRRENQASVEYHFEAKPALKVIPEPSMPGWAEVAPYLHISTYETWEQVGRWYWGLVAEQLAPDAQVRRAAQDAVKGLTTLADKVRAVHRKVIQGTRYVGLEFGIHGYKPYRVSQILSRRFGDCKDKASLLVAMLGEVGIEAQMVLLRTRRGGNVEPSPASLAIFDHAIAYVPALDLYLDGTAEFSGMGELPHQDQGMIGLRVGAKGSLLIQTPVLPSSTNQANRTWMTEVREDGGAHVREQVTVFGQAAPEWRQHYQTPGERQDKYTKVWNARFPGAVVANLEVSGTEDPNVPVKVVAEVDVPQLASTQGKRLLLPLSSRPPEYLRSYARLSSRKLDLQLAYPWQHQEVLTYRLPAGWRVAQVPAARDEQTDFGSFRFAVESSPNGDAVTVRTHLDMRAHRFVPDAYPKFRAFLGVIEAALRERLEIERVGP